MPAYPPPEDNDAAARRGKPHAGRYRRPRLFRHEQSRQTHAKRGPVEYVHFSSLFYWGTAEDVETGRAHPPGTAAEILTAAREHKRSEFWDYGKEKFRRDSRQVLIYLLGGFALFTAVHFFTAH